MPYKVFTEEELEHLVPYTWRRRGNAVDRTRWNPPRVKGACQQHGIPVKDSEVVSLVFEDATSDWEQLVHLESDVETLVDARPYKRGVLIPYDLRHAKHRVACRTSEGKLWVWNVWQYRGPQGELRLESCENFAGMLVEELPNGYRYRCNEGRDDDDYDDLIFRIERTGVVEPPRRKRGSRRQTPSKR